MNKIDWEEVAFSPQAILQRAIVLTMNRIEEAADKRPEFNKETHQYCEVGPHFNQECQTLVNLLMTRQDLSPEFVDSSVPGEQ